MPNFSSSLQRFIYQHLDSVGLMEVLLVLHSSPEQSWSANSLSRELRNNPTAVEQYLKKLEQLKLVVQISATTPEYKYNKESELRQVVEELASMHRLKRHKIYELIYSPMKKARDFSDAFLFSGSEPKKEENDG